MKFLTFLNYGCIEICKNMIESARKVGISTTDFIIYCLDDASYSELKNNFSCVRYNVNISSEYNDWTFDPNSEFRKIVRHKWKIIQDVHNKYKNLCWVDTDIVFIKNPVQIIENNKEILFQCDSPGSLLCSGFMVFNDSIECNDLIEECGNNEVEDDQILLNNIALNKYKNNIAILNPELFPNGKIYYDYQLKKNAFIVHNNHMIGIDTKIQKFKNEGLWFI